MIEHMLTHLRPPARLLFVAAALLAPASARANRPLITIDGTYDDWTGVSAAYTAPIGDGGVSGVDFWHLSLTDDDRFLFLRFETTAEIDLNENNDVAAVNSLEAFINAVQAQRGNKIPEADADALIAAAQQIIDLLTTE